MFIYIFFIFPSVLNPTHPIFRLCSPPPFNFMDLLGFILYSFICPRLSSKEGQIWEVTMLLCGGLGLVAAAFGPALLHPPLSSYLCQTASSLGPATMLQGLTALRTDGPRWFQMKSSEICWQLFMCFHKVNWSTSLGLQRCHGSMCLSF